MLRNQIVTAVTGLALNLISPAQAQTPDFRLGSSMPANQAERSIVIGRDTKWANVTKNEAIRFVVGDREFGWRFDGSASSMDLMRLAPSLLNRPLTIYVARSPGGRTN